MRNRVLGPTHVDSLYTAWRLADSWQRAGEKAAAIAALEDVHSNLKSIDTTASIRRSDPLQNIAHVYAHLDCYDKAVDVRDVVYRMYLNALNPKDFRMVNTGRLQMLMTDYAASPYPEVRNYDRAIELGTKACELDGNRNATIIAILASALASKGDYQAALKNFDRVVDLKTGTAEGQYNIALLRLRRGDATGYRTMCAAMMKQFGSSSNDGELQLTSWACGLGPSAVDDLSAALKVAQGQVAKGPDNPRLLDANGALLYRTGKFEEAAKQFEEVIKAFDKKSVNNTSIAYPQFFLAMSKWKLGELAEAKRLLAEAQTAMDEELKTSPMWSRRATLELFRNEAEELINESTAAVGTPAAAKP